MPIIPNTVFRFSSPDGDKIEFGLEDIGEEPNLDVIEGILLANDVINKYYINIISSPVKKPVPE